MTFLIVPSRPIRPIRGGAPTGLALTLGLVFGSIGCRARSDAAPQTASSAQAIAAASNAAHAASGDPEGAQCSLSNAPSSAIPAASAPPKQDAAPSPPSISPKLSYARRLQAEGKLEEAEKAFLAAIGPANAPDLRAVVEHAYLSLKQNAAPQISDYEDEFLAGTAGERQLAAESWYNLALLYAGAKQSEAERAALARSLELREHKTVRAKLKGRSSCLAEIGDRLTPATPEVVSGWAGVCVSLGLCRKEEDVSSAEARKRSCVTSSGSASEPDEVHGCEGEGPWDSTFLYQMYSRSVAWIAPLGKNRYFVSTGREGSWQSTCRGTNSAAWEKTAQGRYAQLKFTLEPMDAVPGHNVPQGEDENGGCLEPPATEGYAVYALNTGKLLAQLAFPASDAETIKIELDEAGHQLKLEGGNCDGTIPLDGSMRLIQPPKSAEAGKP